LKTEELQMGDYSIVWVLRRGVDFGGNSSACMPPIIKKHPCINQLLTPLPS